MAVAVKATVYCYVTLCSLVDCYQHSGTACYLYHHLGRGDYYICEHLDCG
jgi:hypothetical protein